ncbi:hypothetical protein [Burkholderia gladioli]|uniref:hypothetical protein n=1 Tax=Burkholderia gladioli TaxID=28095 RepID=UPI003D1F8480
MSESKQQWTSGPWELEVNGWDNQVVYGNDARAPGKRRFIAEVSLYYDGANANAKLIAAAPELVEALSELLEYGLKMSGRHHAPAFEKARAALTKAGA